MANAVTARIELAYDGTDFAGWAVQPDQRTVEGELAAAIEQLRGDRPTLTVAGRTDAGVHAVRQVVSHPGLPLRPEALNGVLPRDISVRVSETAPEGFVDARASATSRAYRYRVLQTRTRPLHERRTSFWVPLGIDFDLLQRCAVLLPGEHDMTAFTPSQTEHVHFKRNILSAAWTQEETDEGTRLDFQIEAVSFMRHMNRILVGTMLEVSRGAMTLNQFERLLQGSPRSAAGDTAPARGLTLLGVGYGARVLPGSAA